jgi:hypothetical protein
MGASTSSSGKGNATYPGQGGQPAFGQPNQSMGQLGTGQSIAQFGQPAQYGNTIGQQGMSPNAPGQGWMMQSQQMPNSSGKGQPSKSFSQPQNQGGWDNASLQPQSGGKGGSGGKGQSQPQWQPFSPPSNWNSQSQTGIPMQAQPAVMQPQPNGSGWGGQP